MAARQLRQHIEASNNEAGGGESYRNLEKKS